MILFIQIRSTESPEQKAWLHTLFSRRRGAGEPQSAGSSKEVNIKASSYSSHSFRCATIATIKPIIPF